MSRKKPNTFTPARELPGRPGVFSKDLTLAPRDGSESLSPEQFLISRLSKLNEALKARVDELESVLRVLSDCLPCPIYVYGDKWSSFEPEVDDYEEIDLDKILGIPV